MHSTRNDDLRCRRKSCGRKRKGDNRPYHSALCFWVHKYNQEADSLVANLGHSDVVDDHLLATVELNRALDRVLNSRAELRRLANDAGVDNERWDALVRGRVETAGVQAEDPAG